MNQKTQNRVSMWRAVINALTAYTNGWNAIPAFVAAYTRLLAIIAGVEAAAGTQAAPTTGITDDKAVAEHNAIDAVLDLAGAVRAYAVTQGNNALYAAMDYSEDALGRLPDNELYATLSAILAAITPYQNALADVGVSAADVQAAVAAVAGYHTQLSAPRAAVATGSTATQSIPAMEKEARQILDIMDGLARRLRKTAPQFVSTYRNARIIVDAGIRHNGGNGYGGTVGTSEPQTAEKRNDSAAKPDA